MSRAMFLISLLGLAAPALAQDSECATAEACAEECLDGYDVCGVCGGDNACLADESAESFDDVCIEPVDACGLCGGDGSTCLDCNNIPAGGAELDECGVCGGDNACRDIDVSVSTVAGRAGLEALFSIVLSCDSTVSENTRWLLCDGALPTDLSEIGPAWKVSGGAARASESGGVEIVVDLVPFLELPSRRNEVAVGAPTSIVLNKLPLFEGLPGNQSIRGTFQLDATSGKSLFEGILVDR